MSDLIVVTNAEAASLEHGAAVVLRPLEAFLDDVGLGSDPLKVEAIGDGHSNLTFLLRRGTERYVLRRPPLGELAASTNDVLREASVLVALASTKVPVPQVFACCEDPARIGAPFFVMSHVRGTTINDGLPSVLDTPSAPARILAETVGALAALHATDLDRSGLEAFGRPTGYLERQLGRFGSLLETNATRRLPDLEIVAAWLSDNLPETSEVTFVHGDYRIGNLIFGASLQLTAVLDWEMATVGDPLADLGYCTATWAENGDEENPMFSLSRLTATSGFPGRADVARAYAEQTGRGLEDLGWYQVLALWKSAVFLEGSYRRYHAGASSDPFFASLDRGVPALARAARRWIERFETEDLLRGACS